MYDKCCTIFNKIIHHCYSPSQSPHILFCVAICDVACQNQAFVAEMSCSVMMFLGKNVTLAFI